MAEYLIISNFGPIKNVNLDLKRVFVLIGPQSSGKSVIAKLIAIFRDWEFVVDRVLFKELLKKHNIDTFINDKTVIKYISDHLSFDFQNHEEEFAYNKSHNLYNLLLEYRNLVSKTSPDYKYRVEVSIEELVETVNKKLRDISNNPNISEKDALNGILEKIEILNKFVSHNVRTIDSIKEELLKFINFSEYIPAERILIPIISNTTLSFNNLDIPLPKNLIDFGSSFEKAREALKDVYIEFLEIRYKYSEKENKVYLNAKNSILLNRASSGLQALIPMLLVITYLSPTSKHGHSFIIEEPEQNLFPETQNHLVKFLTEHCTKNDSDSENFNELVITTHSPYVLTSFNNLLLASKMADSSELSKDVENIIPKRFWIRQNDFNAYYIEKGKAQQIFNEQLGLISEDELDTASESIMDEFNQLMDLRRSNRYAR